MRQGYSEWQRLHAYKMLACSKMLAFRSASQLISTSFTVCLLSFAFGKEYLELDLRQARSRRLKTGRSGTVFSEIGGAGR